MLVAVSVQYERACQCVPRPGVATLGLRWPLAASQRGRWDAPCGIRMPRGHGHGRCTHPGAARAKARKAQSSKNSEVRVRDLACTVDIVVFSILGKYVGAVRLWVESE